MTHQPLSNEELRAMREQMEQANKTMDGSMAISCFQHDLPRLLDAYESVMEEIERLKKQDQITGQMYDRLGDELAKMKKENYRLQQALQIYADEDSWLEDCGKKYADVFAFDCPFSVDNCTDIDEKPWLLALKALLEGDNE